MTAWSRYKSIVQFTCGLQLELEKLDEKHSDDKLKRVLLQEILKNINPNHFQLMNLFSNCRCSRGPRLFPRLLHHFPR